MVSVLQPVSTAKPTLRQRLMPYARPAFAVELAACEIMVVSLLFSFNAAVPAWQHPAYWLRHLELLAIVAAVALVLIAWPRRAEIGELWQQTAAGRSWKLPLAANLLIFGGLVIATVALSQAVADAPLGSPPWHLLWIYVVPLLATGLSLVWLAAPPRFWLGLARQLSAEIALAVVAGVALLALGALAQTGWEAMAGITLELVRRLLGLWESAVHVDYLHRAVRVEEFTVIIDQSCSGYEGVALVATFLVLFFWLFRKTLRFPNAFLLLPIGIAAILALNVLRISVLVSIGAHFSADIAAKGFHSQAGWMAFLAVTIAIMALAPRLSFFAHGTDGVAEAAPLPASAVTDDRIIQGMLVPFMAMMAGAIVVSASAPFDTALYAVKIVAATAALYVFRDVWRPLVMAPGPLAVAAGVAVGAAWIATTPVVEEAALGAWLAGQSTAIAALWLAARAAGSVLVVPLVEELAFRGVLYRWVISRRFEAVPFSRLSIGALTVSSMLFGLMHQRWVAGVAAGVVFALVMVRSGRLTDAIWAHVAANAVIVGWALATRQWALL